jgi:hypothetical protein
MDCDHFFHKKEAPELHAALASICVKAEVLRVIW